MPFAVLNKHVDCVAHSKPNIPKSFLKPIFCEFPFNPFRAPWSGDSPSQVAEQDSGVRQYGYLLFTFGWRDDTTNGEVSLMTQ